MARMKVILRRAAKAVIGGVLFEKGKPDWLEFPETRLSWLRKVGFDIIDIEKPVDPTPEPEPDDLMARTRKDLMDMAQEMGLQPSRVATKAQLVAMIKGEEPAADDDGDDEGDED